MSGFSTFARLLGFPTFDGFSSFINNPRIFLRRSNYRVAS
jgi:hypothetical protein